MHRRVERRDAERGRERETRKKGRRREAERETTEVRRKDRDGG